MNASEIARALGGHRSGRWWRCRCPVHQGKQESLALRDRERGLAICCHAGCERADVIAELERLGVLAGAYTRPAALPDDASLNERNRAIAKRVWDAARPDAPELARYLRARAITMPAPRSLRFLWACFHKPTCSHYPAMIARISDVDGAFLGIQRTYLSDDFLSKAPIAPAKMTLGRIGNGAVQLAPAGPVLMLAEGVETALSVMQDTGLPAWATLSHVNLRVCAIPPIVREVILLADHDANPVVRAKVWDSLKQARDRFVRRGLNVRIPIPPEGMDFNDVLRQRNIPCLPPSPLVSGSSKVSTRSLPNAPA